MFSDSNESNHASNKCQDDCLANLLEQCACGNCFLGPVIMLETAQERYLAE